MLPVGSVPGVPDVIRLVGGARIGPTFGHRWLSVVSEPGVVRRAILDQDGARVVDELGKPGHASGVGMLALDGRPIGRLDLLSRRGRLNAQDFVGVEPSQVRKVV